jgi:hypothetical protein
MTIFVMTTELMRIGLQLREKDAFQKAADMAGIALSAWVRERLRRTAVRELEDAGKSIPFLRQDADR